MMVGGIAVGVIGSRLLPPLMAMGTGMVKSGAGGDPFGRLENDHRLILKALRSMENAPAESTTKRASLFLC